MTDEEMDQAISAMRRLGVNPSKVSHRVDVHLGLWDRIRVLFGAPLRIWVDGTFENDPGRCLRSGSEVLVGMSAQLAVTAQSLERH